MADKIAVPFWLCWSASLIVGLVTGRLALWLAVGAAVGLVLGFIVGANAKRKQRQSFHGKIRTSSSTTSPAVSLPEVKRAA